MYGEYLSTCKDLKSGRFAPVQNFSNVLECSGIALTKALENSSRRRCRRHGCDRRGMPSNWRCTLSLLNVCVCVLYVGGASCPSSNCETRIFRNFCWCAREGAEEENSAKKAFDQLLERMYVCMYVGGYWRETEAAPKLWSSAMVTTLSAPPASPSSGRAPPVPLQGFLGRALDIHQRWSLRGRVEERGGQCQAGSSMCVCVCVCVCLCVYMGTGCASYPSLNCGARSSESPQILLVCARESEREENSDT